MTRSQMTTSEKEPQTSQHVDATSSEPRQHHGKTGVDKAQSYLAVVSTSIGILGAIGTAFVWIVANICLGDVEIKPSKPVDTVMVKVIDKKGQQATYFTKHVQLMPGSYHLEVGVPDKKPTAHFDVDVQLWKGQVIPYTVPEQFTADTAAHADGENEVSTDSQNAGNKKRWWQFWRKKEESK